MSRVIKPWGFLLVAVLAAGVSRAQQTPAVPRTAATVDVTLFNLDVVVTDAAGNAVHGLTAADFEVRHGGRVVQVTNFHEVRGTGFPAVSVAPPPPAEAGAPAPAPQEAIAPRPPRRIVLFLDRLQIPDPGQRHQLFDSLRKLLLEDLAPGDEAMVVTWDRSIRTILPFTGDPERLERTLDLTEEGSGRMPSEVADLNLLRAEDEWLQALAADPRIGTDFGGFQPSAEREANQALFEMKAKTAALKGLAATLGGMEGRKVIVLVTHRFSRYAGLEFFLRNRSDGEELSNPRTRKIDVKPLLEEVTRTANANGVTLYALFPAGMSTPLPSAADPRGENPDINSPLAGGRDRLALANEVEALDFVADQTGGVAAVGLGSVPGFVDRVAADLDSWYSLGYPAPPGSGKAAPVSVRVKGRKLAVRVRGSLLEKSLEEMMQDRVVSNLFQPDARARIPIKVTATLVSKPSEKFRMKVEVSIPIGSLVLLPTAKGAAGAFSVFVASIGPKGDFSDVIRRSQPFEIPQKDLEQAKAGHYTYEVEVKSGSPGDRFSVGVWDEKGNDAGFAVVRPSGPPVG